MGLDGLPPLDASARYRAETNSDTARKPAKNAKASEAKPVEAFHKIIDQQQADLAKPEPADPKAAEEKKPETTTEKFQAMQESARQSQAYQTSRQVASLEQSILEAQRELARQTNETGETAAAEGKPFSYWDRLEVMEKAQKINQLKNKIAGMQLERSELIASLREQVVNGSYHASGSQILEGMVREFF